jgi:hypothetical protein
MPTSCMKSLTPLEAEESSRAYNAEDAQAAAQSPKSSQNTTHEN